MKNIIACWDEKALDWKSYVGERGDNNRFFHSDPVLWKFLGEIGNRSILDAGCGSGYLSIQMARKGARVVGVDISKKMIEQAYLLSNEAQGHEVSHSYGRKLELEFRVDSIEALSTVADSSVELLVSNYVLMDTPNLSAAIRSFFRVLKNGGAAVVVFSHPCFNNLTSEEMYFDEIEKTEKWGPFKSEFIYFHRPLSEYWRVFQSVGFIVENFDEPLADPNTEGFKEVWIADYKKRPWSVAFKLRKPGGLTFID